jgi:transcriptional regulator GlxA family with amidase domain
MHYESFKYEPQIIDVEAALKNDILQISKLLSMGQLEILEAYSRFYQLLKTVISKTKQSNITFDKTLQTAVEYLTANWDKSVSVASLAKKCCVSESTIYHLFQKVLGQTPISFLNSIKINIAMDYLENSSYSVATISRLVGFNSENHFRKVFAEFTGTTPLKYRKAK